MEGVCVPRFVGFRLDFALILTGTLEADSRPSSKQT